MAFVVMYNARPQATSNTQRQARVFAYTRAVNRPNASATWNKTGKLIVGGRWTGWEVLSVASVRPTLTAGMSADERVMA